MSNKATIIDPPLTRDGFAKTSLTRLAAHT
jgi:hypothetical protein